MEQIHKRPDRALTVWRALNHVTQMELAKTLGDRFTSPMISNIEQGLTRPAPEYAKRLEEITGIPASAWFEEADS